jgi:O-antigen/teichoic acid export membrane protein
LTAALPARFRRNTLTLYLNTITSAAVALVMTPVLAHGLGRHDYGIWVVVGGLILYLELLEFGFGTATIKYVAEFDSLDDRDGVRATITTSFWILAVPGLLALLAGAVMAGVFTEIFELREGVETSARLLILMLSLNMAISIPGDTFGGALLGLQRYDLQNATLIAVAIAQAIGWAIVLASGGGLVALGVVTVTFGLLGQLSRYFLVRRLVPGVSISRRDFRRDLVRPVAGLSFWFALGEIADVVVFRIDAIVVGIVVGIPAAGIYAVGQKLALVVEKLVQPAVYTLFPHAAGLSAHDDREGLRAMLVTGTRISLGIAGPLTVTLAVLGEPAVRAWVGPEFAAAGVVVVYLAATTAIKSVVQTGRTMTSGMGLARVPAMIVTGEALLNLVLSVVFGRAMGLQGVALGTLIAAAVTDIGLLLPYICKQLHVSLPAFAGSVLKAHVPGAAAALLVGWLALRLGVTGIAPVLLAGIAIGGTYMAVFFTTGLTSAERAVVVAKMSRRPRKGADGGAASR